MSAKDILSSKKILSDKDLEDVLEASDFSDISDLDGTDSEEIDADYDSDDTIADNNFVPDPLDDDLYTDELQELWRRDHKRKQGTTSNKLQPKKAKLSNADASFYSDETGSLHLNQEDTLPGNLFGKDGYKWSGISPTPETGKTPARNVVYIRPGPVGSAKELTEPIDTFSLFFNDDILTDILIYTNQRILVLQNKYKTQNASTSVTSISELKALFGLLFLAAALKDNHLSAELLFDDSYSGSRYRATMSRTRFLFLQYALRFDDQLTRSERTEVSRFAPISDLWDKFINNCTASYKPSAYLCIDEQLVGFRGRCPFRIYIPNKPNKYGIKIIMVCDVATKYVVNASPYLGKSTKTNGVPLANYFVELLTRPVWGTNRNITMDNWFTNIPLGNKLLEAPFKLTIVGTLRKNKPQIPPQLLDIKSRSCKTSMAVFTENSTLISYKPKENKNVLLLSTMHSSNALNPKTSKPEIIHVYNSTKGAVDTFDQMSQNICCNRKTRRWPLCFFYNMLNIAAINSYVIYNHNVTALKKKPVSRVKYMLTLHEQLTLPWQETRRSIPTLPRDLKECISNVLGEKTSTTTKMEQKGKRSYCSICPSSKKRMTTTHCYTCPRALCGEHQIKICYECVEKNNK